MDPVQTQLPRKAPGSSSLAHVRPPTPDGVLADRPSAGEAFETPESSSEARPFACQTRFGGLFYLLNALLHMNVYGDFTQPRRRAIDLSPWDFLAICGEEWFGARFANDALAPFLARLAGRERGAPIERPRWLRRLLPRIETRIAQALGERRTRRALVRLAVSRARAVDSGTCLDVHFDLARLPLPVRFAGLDRDPGWIPAAARIVAFHFD